MYNIGTHYSHTITPLENGIVRLTLDIEATNARAFLLMLESLAGFFRIVSNKAKASLALQRLPQIRIEGENHYEKYCAAVVQMFKIYRIEAQNNLIPPTPEHARALLSKVNIAMKDEYPNSSYDEVKRLLIKSGELRKAGYYTSKDL